MSPGASRKPKRTKLVRATRQKYADTASGQATANARNSHERLQQGRIDALFYPACWYSAIFRAQPDTSDVVLGWRANELKERVVIYGYGRGSRPIYIQEGSGRNSPCNSRTRPEDQFYREPLYFNRSAALIYL